jgi:nucleotide-binding universal stress UspA family protein
MKMQSGNAISWLSNLPPILARVFTGRAIKGQPAKTSKTGVLDTGVNPQSSTDEGEGTTVRTAPRKPTRRPEIMVPVDFSPESMRAADYAINVAQRTRARLILLHAVHLNLTPYGPANPAWLRAALCREALEKMEGIMTRAQQADVPAISVIEEGPPVKVISQVAKRWKVDLMVMASHRRGKWARFFGQRIRERVVRGAECPIVVVQADAKQGVTV